MPKKSNATLYLAETNTIVCIIIVAVQIIYKNTNALKIYVKFMYSIVMDNFYNVSKDG